MQKHDFSTAHGTIKPLLAALTSLFELFQNFDVASAQPPPSKKQKSPAHPLTRKGLFSATVESIKLYAGLKTTDLSPTWALAICAAYYEVHFVV